MIEVFILLWIKCGLFAYIISLIYSLLFEFDRNKPRTCIDIAAHITFLFIMLLIYCVGGGYSLFKVLSYCYITTVNTYMEYKDERNSK